MGIKTVPHPPYCPDIAPCDFCLFPKLRGCRYETIEEMKEAVTKVIDTLTQEDFHGVFQLLERYNKCSAGGGDYFEGDYSFICVLSIKVPIRKKSGNLSYAPRIISKYKDRNTGHPVRIELTHKVLIINFYITWDAQLNLGNNSQVILKAPVSNISPKLSNYEPVHLWDGWPRTNKDYG